MLFWLWLGFFSVPYWTVDTWVDTDSWAFRFFACWRPHWPNLDFQTAWKDTENYFPANLRQSISIRVFFFSRATVVCDKKNLKNPWVVPQPSPPSLAPPPLAQSDSETFHVIGHPTFMVHGLINKILLASISFELSRLKSPLRLPVSCNQQIFCILCIWRLTVKYYHVVTKKKKNQRL